MGKRAKVGEPRAFLDSLGLTGTGCVTWPYATNNAGYGQINIGGGKKVLSHRISCEKVNGPAPTPSHFAAHSCGKGHEACVAPWHLSWKTPAENNADMDIHGTRLRGEKSPNAKMTQSDVEFIRETSGKLSHLEISKRLGVSQGAVSRVARGDAWASNPTTPARTMKYGRNGVPGVRPVGGRWEARATVNGRTVQVGTFDSEPEAIKARADVLGWGEEMLGVK